MAKEAPVTGNTEETTAMQPVPVPRQEKIAPAPGTYIGPQPAPLISNLPGDVQRYRADQLPERYREFVIATIPEAKYWWAK